ncbi:GNAT family N-acetyltransferase [Dolichospermum circinale CS-1225]|uniref:GNAT family N-acetyltransferase n=1 Tax=Dolichospermum circinale CS-537/01 TaxID=3021739 RepID=A0ABT5A9F9_9CYAN|nr:GNAT family N-acetyltransferase [Dolichospermum circinale]MDB9457611.1 GNAT family N-acetyltransferase [Dolichospermum circinale CS-545/17]MDB9464994.1 GNAT family N-acetyltransferase [Dolichospermum circinale CS-539/09]MDB9470649.1 GNAT family N-acetyltransferase [Dolichospermum circinale CS-539]MDB9487812.1 GNAT family N-acetyltransferase [Dolichospermum circinale CS-537/01]MDB9523461.1 GNAT family N-acetyltransferase [Dolichospermum circinale CS-1225]
MNLLPGYAIEQGSTVDQALLVKFMERTYQEQFPNQNFSHLTRTVEQYFSRDTPLWWVYDEQETKNQHQSPIGCLWVGNAIDQVSGDRHPHIFLLYVMPEYRHRGIGKALMNYIENWAKQRGYGKIGLQVFQTNIPALDLYHQLGYQEQSLWMVKSL